jgi:hypothetical protein
MIFCRSGQCPWQTPKRWRSCAPLNPNTMRCWSAGWNVQTRRTDKGSHNLRFPALRFPGPGIAVRRPTEFASRCSTQAHIPHTVLIPEGAPARGSGGNAIAEANQYRSAAPARVRETNSSRRWPESPGSVKAFVAADRHLVAGQSPIFLILGRCRNPSPFNGYLSCATDRIAHGIADALLLVRRRLRASNR